MVRSQSALALFSNDTDGASTAWTIFWSVIFLIVGGFVIDTANAYRFKAALQATADSSAMAGLIAYYDARRYREITRDEDHLTASSRAKRAAVHLSKVNMSTNGNGEVVVEDDVKTGFWDGKEFTTSGPFTNAVSVTAQRSKARGNAVGTLLLGAYSSFRSWDVGATAIAAYNTDCKSGGLFSRRKVLSGSNNDYGGGFCLHGKLGVRVGSDNSFAPGSVVSMEDLVNLEQRGGNRGLSNALKNAEETIILPANVAAIVAHMQSGDLSDLPPSITKVEYLPVITDTTPLIEGTLYIVAGGVDFGSGRILKDIAVVAGLDVLAGDNVEMENVVLATNGQIKFGHRGKYGRSEYCDGGKYDVYALAGGKIEFGLDSQLNGAFLVTNADLILGNRIDALNSVYAEASEVIVYGTAKSYGSCATQLDSVFPVATGNGDQRNKFVMVQ